MTDRKSASGARNGMRPRRLELLLLSVPPTNRSATTAPQTANTPSIRNAIWMPSEHQPPADRISEHASEQRPERIAESGRTQTAGESCPALRAETEPHAQDGRPHHRAANAHDEAGGEQQPNVRRETTDHRERGEDAGTDEKDASAAEHIGEPAAGDDGYAKYHGVAVDHPLRGVDAGAEGFLDGREGDRERGEVIGITNTATAMAIMPRIADLPRGASVSATVPVAS
jgi:hypothetical protein